MNFLPLYAITIVLYICGKCSCEIPSDIQKCHAGDVLCIAKTINDIVHKNPNGNEKLGLRGLEPVHLDELLVSRAQSNSPLQLNLKFTNLDMYGLTKINVTRVVGFEKDPRKSKFEIYLTAPLLTFRGQYETDGKILLLPIVGKGNAEIQIKNVKSGVKAQINTTNENGKLRVAISKLKVQNDPELLTVRLDNLFNGNKVLGDDINNVINSNWKDVWTEMESGINDGYKRIINFLMGDVLKAISYDEFYIE